MKAKMIVGGMFAMVMSVMAQEEAGPAVNQVVYEVFSLDRSVAAASQRGATTDAELYALILKDLKSGKVKQEKLLAIRAMSGQSSQTEHVSEFIYATEYEPPELPNSIGLPVDSAALTKEKPTGEEVIDALRKGVGWSEGNFPATPASGSAFDTMKLGDTLEVEVTKGPPGSSDLLQLRFAATHVSLVGFETWGQGLAESKMPSFEHRKIQSTVEVKAGAPTLVGTVSPPADQTKEGEEPRVWFAFVTVSVVEVGK